MLENHGHVDLLMMGGRESLIDSVDGLQKRFER